MSASLPSTVLFAISTLVLTPVLSAQEPSANLKQADTVYRSGVAALAKNDVAQAQKDFEEVVRLAPQAEQGYSALGATLVRAGNVDKGIRDLQKALTMKPSDDSARLNLALAYAQTGANDKALPLFARLETTAKTSGHVLAPYVRAAYACALAATRPEAAIAQMQAAVSSEPGNAQWREELGSLYAQQRQWQLAETSFRETIRLDPQSPEAHLRLGSALARQHDARALDELRQAMQLAPADEQAGLETGNALVEFDQPGEAVRVFKETYAAHPESLEAAYQLALTLQLTGDPQAAMPLFEKVIAAEPKNANALTNLGMAYLQQQRAKDALTELQQAVKLAPESVTAHQDLAAAYIQLNQIDDAIEQLRSALALAQDLPALHYNLGLAFKMKDDAASAIAELALAEKLNPDGHEAPYVLGVLYMQTGRYEDAARELGRSLQLEPQNGDGWATLGSVYARLNQGPQAIEALHKAIEQSPEQPDPHLTLATVLVKQGDTTGAAAERKHAADLMRTNMNRQRAEVAASAANGLLQNGKVDDAIAGFKEALGYDPGLAAAHSGLAAAFDRKGDAFAAADERQKALASSTAPSP